MAEYGRSKEAFVRRLLDLPNGIPSHDTFNRVFARLDPDAFAAGFGRWMAAACEGTGLTPIAFGCQVEIAKQVRTQGGDYLLAIQGSQPTLHEAVTAVFERASAGDFAGVAYDVHESVEDAHGRHEERYVTAIYNPEGLPADWPDVAAVVLVGREREVAGVNTSTAHFCVIGHRGTAAALGRLVRGHWGIETRGRTIRPIDRFATASRTSGHSGSAGCNSGVHGGWKCGTTSTGTTSAAGGRPILQRRQQLRSL
ncbi:MAG TPA: ISAs1 family transposase, partial [Urbifossiella sp.]|nr:ISAs1 family transposase [Urbifossiella sp.]